MAEKGVPSLSELYEIILERSPLPLPGFEAHFNAKTVRRAGRIHDYLKNRAEREMWTAARMYWLGEELYPLTQHPHLYVEPNPDQLYDPKTDTFHMDIVPRCPYNWAKTAYKFARQPGMKYDRETKLYILDGRPKASRGGMNWVRFIGEFKDGSKVTLHIMSSQPSYQEAQDQLEEFFGYFRADHGLSPQEVFLKYW